MKSPKTQKSPLFSGLMLLVLGSFVWAPNAMAYLDPGTGTMIIQMIVAAVVGSFVAIKIYWFKIRTFFARTFKKDKKEEKNTP